MQSSPSPAEIRAARKAAGLTQARAAQLIHCSRSSWAEWESGVSKMHPAFWELFLLKTGQPEPPATTPD